MNFIESVEIEGLWGEKHIKFDLNSDINFIIGTNGSGKTTVINLIAAILTANYGELERLEFKKSVIKLSSTSQNQRPTITVSKKTKKNSRFSSIKYELLTAEGVKLSFQWDELDGRAFKHLSSLSEFDGFTIPQRPETKRHLTDLVNVSWLPVNRSDHTKTTHEKERFETSVDQKLIDLTNRLVRYLSTLEMRASTLLEDFQKEVFLSLLQRESEKLEIEKALGINPQELYQTLELILTQFKVAPNTFKTRLENHIKNLNAAKQKIESKTGLTGPELAIVLETTKISYIAEEWNNTISKRSEIFEPRDTFLSILNSMLQNKSTSINSQNSIEVTTQSGKTLPLQKLSSGEKQLFIILGEALLQKKQPCIYIADEPELSLHITWQERLVENLRSINPNSQIIFATHSPDIVREPLKNYSKLVKWHLSYRR